MRYVMCAKYSSLFVSFSVDMTDEIINRFQFVCLASSINHNAFFKRAKATQRSL